MAPGRCEVFRISGVISEDCRPRISPCHLVITAAVCISTLYRDFPRQQSHQHHYHQRQSPCPPSASSTSASSPSQSSHLHPPAPRHDVDTVHLQEDKSGHHDCVQLRSGVDISNRDNNTSSCTLGLGSGLGSSGLSFSSGYSSPGLSGYTFSSYIASTSSAYCPASSAASVVLR